MERMIKIKTILFNEKKNQKIEIYQTDNLIVIFKSAITDKKSNHHFDFSDIKPKITGQNMLCISQNGFSILLNKFSNENKANAYAKSYAKYHLTNEGYCVANCKAQEQKNQKIVQCMKNVAKQYPDFFCDLSEDV